MQDDIERLGSTSDVTYAITRCEAAKDSFGEVNAARSNEPTLTLLLLSSLCIVFMAQGCGIAFLGIAFSSYLLSHAYYVSPNAARMLINSTRETCNQRSQDYAMRDLCIHNQSVCSRPLSSNRRHSSPRNTLLWTPDFGSWVPIRTSPLYSPLSDLTT